MKKLEFCVPGINLSNIDRDRLVTFAEKHHDNFVMSIKDTPEYADREKQIQMTFVRVVHAETGIRFHMLETEDGNFAVYMPDAWHALEYRQLFDTVHPYLSELLPTYARNFEPVPVFVSYD